MHEKLTKGVSLNPPSKHFENIFPKRQCSFRKGLEAQYCLISMIKKWKKLEEKTSSGWGGLLLLS